MRVECVRAVQRAIGRELTRAEQRGIEERVTATMRRMAAREPERFKTMPRSERLSVVGQVVAKDLEETAARRQERAALQIEAHERHVPDVQAAGRRGFEVIQEKLRQADAYVKGVHREYLRQALDAIDYATQQDTGSIVMRGVRWISNLENPEKAFAFVREVLGEPTGDTGAKAAAGAWNKTVEGMRERFNAAGGAVRKLGYGYLPQPHDVGRVRAAGIQVWVNDALQFVDRSRYVSESGRQLTDAELGEVLEQAWRTISSDGWNHIEPGQFRGEGALANAGAQARVLHFKDAASYVAYLGKYGEGSVFTALSEHLSWMARNIALAETFGPNPNATFRTMHDIAKQAGGVDRVALLTNTDDMWKTLTGAFNEPHSQRAARIWQGMRNVEVFGKLQGMLLSSITDVPAYFATLGYNRLSFWQGSINLVRAFGSDAREFADLAGLIADSKISDMNRFAEDNIGHGWTAGLANATVKATLAAGWTNALRRGFSITMMGGMARIAKTPWEQLEAGDRSRLARKGWTPEEWAVLQRAEPEMWRKTPMLTPATILRAEGVDDAIKQRAVSRLLGTIVDESEFASVGPDLDTRTLQAGGLQRGTGKGELWRSMMLFKSFPIAMMTRHLDRAVSGDMTPAGRLAYASALAFGMTLFGAIALQLKDIVAGRDPRDATGGWGEDPQRAVKFWLAAFQQGGGAGFLADLLLTGQGRGGQSGAAAAMGSLAGPVVGSVAELGLDVIAENLREAAQGKETHAGAEAFRWLRGHTPFVNLWYGKLAIDQAVLNQAQEALSPGYLGKVRARAEREWGSSWWWEPQPSGMFSEQGFEGPQRAPRLGAAVGQR